MERKKARTAGPSSRAPSGIRSAGSSRSAARVSATAPRRATTERGPREASTASTARPSATAAVRRQGQSAGSPASSSRWCGARPSRRNGSRICGSGRTMDSGRVTTIRPIAPPRTKEARASAPDSTRTGSRPTRRASASASASPGSTSSPGAAPRYRGPMVQPPRHMFPDAISRVSAQNIAAATPSWICRSRRPLPCPHTSHGAATPSSPSHSQGLVPKRP